MTIPEVGSAAAIAQGLALFAALGVIGVLVGLGALSLTGVVAESRRRWMLAPFIATVIWALPADLLVRVGLTMAQITPWVLLVSLVLAAIGATAVIRMAWRDYAGAALVGMCWLVALVLMWPIAMRGLTATIGSGNLDTAYYSTMASAYWRYGITDVVRTELFFERFLEPHMRLGDARNHTYVLLALFSPLVQVGEPLFVRNIFAAWSLFTIACTMGFFGWSWHRPAEPPPRFVRAVAFSVTGAGIGWAAVPTLVGNWDNGLFVCVGPALAGLTVRPPSPGFAYPFLLGTIAAYGFYTYPELTPFLYLLVLPLLAVHLRNGATRRVAAARYALAALVAGAIASIGAGPLLRFILDQVSLSRPGHEVRPGGAFAQGLVLVRQDAAAWWAMGTEHAVEAAWSIASGLGVVLTVLAAAGCVRLVRRGALGEVAAVAMLVVLAAYFSVIDSYGYATYKILSVAWWIVVLCLVEGLRGVAAWRMASMAAGHRTRALAGAAAVLAILAASLVVQTAHRWTIYDSTFVTSRQPSIASLVRLRDAAATEGPRDVLVAGALSDYSVMPWIFYALKDSPLRPFHENGIRTRVPGGAGWSRKDVVPDTTLLAAGEAHGARHLLQLPEFDLVDSRTLIVVARVENPNGIEAWGSWLGTEPIAVTLHGASGQQAELRFEAEPGPSLPASPERTLVLNTDGARVATRRIRGKMDVTFAFVTTGQSQILELSTTERPSVSVMPNGDHRPLMVAIRRIQVTLADRERTR